VCDVELHFGHAIGDADVLALLVVRLDGLKIANLSFRMGIG
jgi:hypothetical protein